MGRIFISHASADNVAALEMRDWLEASGWHDVFLDLDPTHGVRAGDVWQQALLGAADRCEAIICLLTPAWVDSKWCWAEYVLAKKLGKRCFPVIVMPIDWDLLPQELRTEHQIVDIANDPAAWTRLRIGLEAAGVEANNFALPPGHRPYPGLRALAEDDAALFFGRAAEILAALDELRRMAATPTRRLLVLLGPSGAGKSSLLRAGLWPRLARDDRNFLPLPTIRPGGAALTGQMGLWASIEGALGERHIASQLPRDLPRTRGEIRAMASQNGAACQDLLEALAQAAAEATLLEHGARPTIVVPIDQGEELFNVDGREEADRFLALLGELLAAPSGPLAILAIRTDVYPRLQADRRIADGLHQPFNLAPMPPDRFRTVIEGPAARAAVQLEPALTDVLVRDASGADALPLLAFTIERLHREFGAAGRLRLADYEAIGGVQGAIEAAVVSAFQAAPARGLARDHDTLVQLTRHIFLPHLVRVNEAGEFTRRTAPLNDIPEDAHALVDLLVDHRLLVADRDETRGIATVEIAHEALLRAWPRMSAWLNEERDFLTWREEIARTRTRWEGKQRDLLTGRELVVALDWQAVRVTDIAAADLTFIAASEERAIAAAARAKRRQARIVWLAVTAAVVFAVLGGISLWQRFAAVSARDAALTAQEEAQRQAALARARELAIHAETTLDQRAGKTTLAGLLAVESLRASPTIEGYRAGRRVMALTPSDTASLKTPWPWSQITPSADRRWLAFSRYRGAPEQIPAAGAAVLIDVGSSTPSATFRHDGWVRPVFSPDGRRVAIGGYGRALQVVDVATRNVEVTAHYDDMIAAVFGPSGKRLFVGRPDGFVEIREGPEWRVTQRLSFAVGEPRPREIALTVSPDGQRVAVATRDPKAYVIPVDGSPAVSLSGHERGVLGALFDATGTRIITRSWDQTVRVWDIRAGTQIHAFEHPNPITALAASTVSSTLVSAMRSGEVFVWDAATGERRRVLSHDAYVNAVAISPQDTFLATASDDGTAAVWDLQTGEQRRRWQHDDEVWSVAFSADGRTVVTGSKDGSVRFFDVPSGQELRRAMMGGGVVSLDLAPSSNMLAAGIALTKHRQAWADVVIADRQTHEPVAAFSHNGWFGSVVFSPDGNTLATTTIGPGDIKLWDVLSGTLRVAPNVTAYALSYTPDSARLVTDPGRGEAFVLDAKTGHPIASIGEPGGIHAVGLAADQRTITTYGRDGWWRGWDALTGAPLWQRQQTRGDKYPKLSADGRRFATFSTAGQTTEIADAKSGSLIVAIPATDRTSAHLSHDGRRLLLTRHVSAAPGASGNAFVEVELWDVDQNKRLLHRKLSDIASARFGEASAILIIEDRRTKRVELLDAQDGQTIWSHVDGGYVRSLFVPTHRILVGSDIRDFTTDSFIAQLSGEPNDVTASPDGSTLVVAVGNRVEIRDAATGELLRQLEAGGSVRNVTVSADGGRLFAAVRGVQHVQVWNLADGSEVARLTMDSAVRHIQSTADADLVLAYDTSDTLRVWRLSTGEEEHRFAHTATVAAIAVATAADRAVTWHAASLRVWDTRTGAEVARRVSAGDVKSLAVSPDGRWVAYVTDRPRHTDTGAAYGGLVLWEPTSGRDPLIVPTSNAREVVFGPRGRHVAARLGKDTVAVWEISSRRNIATLRALADSEIKDIAFSPDSARLLVTEHGSSPGSSYVLRVWDLSEQRELARVDLRGSMVQMPGSDTIMTQDDEGAWHVWSPTSAHVETTTWPAQTLRWLARDPASGRLAYVTRDGSAAVLDVDTGQHMVLSTQLENARADALAVAPGAAHIAVSVFRWRPGGQDAKPMTTVHDAATGQAVGRIEHDTPMTALLFVDGDAAIVTVEASPSRSLLLATTLRLRQWRIGEVRTLIPNNPINAIAASPDGAVFATGEGDVDADKSPAMDVGVMQARLWDAQTGKELFRLPHEQPVYDVAFSPDGRLLATRSTREVSVFRVADGTKVIAFRMAWGLSGGTATVAFAAAGRYVVANVGDSNMGDNTEEGVRVWAVDGTGSHLLRHEGDWPSFAISGNGAYLATSKGNTVRVWHIASGTELARASWPQVWRLMFAGKRDDLIVNAGGRLIRMLWRPEDLIAEACRRFSRSMTEAEWRRFFDAVPYRASCADDASDVLNATGRLRPAHTRR